MDQLAKIVNRLSEIVGIAAGVMLVLAVLVLNYMIVVRVLGYSSYWEIEFSVYLLVAATFLGSPFTLKHAGHIGIDFLPTVLRGRWSRILRSAAALLGLVVCTFLAWQGADFAFEAYTIGEVAESIWAPLLWPIKSTMAFGLFLTAIQYIVLIWERAPIVPAEAGH